ncbi:Ribosome assembly protein 4 [Rhizoctonia solani]|uniref:Ribosome assembly protein 4 n=1 Tax=Rhizoctonia solani TaxID=456999 RepID=A0A0K6G6U8_9AGAM|nr:Ribosome assembly protein 4 [Rhizoctonia solani]
MEKVSSKLKRKHTKSTAAEDYLHPGERRDGKRSRSPSRSNSPTASEATPGTSGSNDDTQPHQISQEHSSSSGTPQEYNVPPTIGPVPAIILPNSRNATNTTTAWSGLEKALQALRLTAKACTPLRLAVDDLVSCLSLFEAAAKNRKDYDDLASGLKSMVGILIKHLEDAASENISNTLVGIAEAIRREIESIGNRQSREGLRRVLGSTGDEEDLIRRYRRIEQLFRQLQGEASLSAWNISSKVHVNMQLESLRAAKLARYDSELATEVSRRACTENTRTKVLEDLIEWSEDRSMASIYWMNGMAGTGKTTIAYSACAALESSKKLAASFFCTRMSPDCRDAKRIVPTIAYQLARRSTPFRSALCKALEEDPDISTGIISVQFDRLLKKPLIEAKSNMPNNLVIVVDALDECSDPYVVELFLDVLFRSVVELPLKFFVTSRPEPIIRRRMMLEGSGLRTILYLHEIEQSLVQADVELYLKEELKFLAPTDDTIKQLAAYAGNLFIYAATAVRYIRPDRRLVDSRKRLETILAIDTKAKKGLSALDTLYCTILTMAIEDPAVEDEERRNMQLIIWTSVCTLEPVLIKTLGAISGVNTKDATIAALEPLRSVLHVSDHNNLVATLHASFPDYILNHERSGQFSCDVPRHNQFISERCFEIMKAQLRFNICNIKSSFIPDAEIPDLKEQIAANISEELFYACRFWMDHLEPALASGAQNSTEAPPLSPFLNIFLSKYLLFWMEVLNLKRSLLVGITSISKLSVWLDRLEDKSTLFELASSAQSFVISYASWPISNYTAHIYLSALPFAISMSHYLPKFTGLVKVSGTILGRIDQAPLSSWQYESTVFSTAFSPKVDRILLGKENGELTVQNVHDGKYLFQPFKAHEEAIVAMSVSCDGAKVVTGSRDMTLSIWNTRDGSLVSGPFRAHTDAVVSVSFSPDATNIASGSDDCTVGIWVSHDASALVKRFTGHEKGVNSVAFSADGTHVISGSSDGTIRIWDIFNETSIHTLGERGGVPITAIHFTPDKTNIVSLSLGSYTSEISVWDASNGSCRRRRRNSPAVSLVAFSPGGDRMAGARHKSIYVWDMGADVEIADSFNHREQVTSVGFSADANGPTYGFPRDTDPSGEPSRPNVCNCVRPYEYCYY